MLMVYVSVYVSLAMACKATMNRLIKDQPIWIK